MFTFVFVFVVMVLVFMLLMLVAVFMIMVIMRVIIAGIRIIVRLALFSMLAVEIVIARAVLRFLFRVFGFQFFRRR